MPYKNNAFQFITTKFSKIVSLIKKFFFPLICFVYMCVSIFNIFQSSYVKVNSIYYSSYIYFIYLIAFPGIFSFIIMFFSFKTQTLKAIKQIQKYYTLISLIICPLSIFLLLFINIDLPKFSITPYISRILMTFSVKYSVMIIVLFNLFFWIFNNFSFSKISLPSFSKGSIYKIQIILLITFCLSLSLKYYQIAVLLLILLSMSLFSYNKKYERFEPAKITIFLIVLAAFFPLELLFFGKNEILYKFIFI